MFQANLDDFEVGSILYDLVQQRDMIVDVDTNGNKVLKDFSKESVWIDEVTQIHNEKNAPDPLFTEVFLQEWGMHIKNTDKSDAMNQAMNHLADFWKKYIISK